MDGKEKRFLYWTWRESFLRYTQLCTGYFFQRRSDSELLFGTCIPNEETSCTEIGRKAWLFAKLQPGRARKRINAT